MKYQDIGVDLGNRILKISTLNINENDAIKYSLLNFKEYIVTNHADLKIYFKFVETSIRNFIKENKIKKPRINFTIPCDNDNLIVHSIKLPKVEKQILEDSILIEIESRQPLNIKEYQHKYEIIEEDDEFIKIISSLIKKDFVEHVLSLRSLSWKIEQLEPQFYTGQKFIKTDSILIDFGFNDTRVYLYEDKLMKDIDVIPIGVSSFIDKIKDMYDINLEQSEEILKISQIKDSSSHLSEETLDFVVDEDLKFLIDELTTIASNIAEEIKRNIRVMELNNNIIIDDFYYSGEISSLTNFIGFISTALDVTMKPFNLLNPLNLDFDAYISDLYNSSSEESTINEVLDYIEYEKNNTNKYMYSLLSNLKNDSIFNFLKGIKFHIDKSSLIVGLICATIVSQVGLRFINTNYDKKINLANGYLSNIESQNSELESEIMSLNNNMDRNKTIINRVENLKDKKKWLSDILYVLPGGTPTNTGITHVSIEAGHAVLEGFSEDYSGIGYLAMELEKYGEVNITEVGEKTDPDDYRVEGNVKMYKEFIIDITYDHRLISDDEPVVNNSQELKEEDHEIDEEDDTKEEIKDITPNDLIDQLEKVEA